MARYYQACWAKQTLEVDAVYGEGQKDRKTGEDLSGKPFVKKLKVTLCEPEREPSVMPTVAGDPLRITCPKCSAAYWAAKLEEFTGRFELRHIKRGKTGYQEFRSKNEVYVDNVFYGYVTCENGFGHGWRARCVENAEYGGEIGAQKPSGAIDVRVDTRLDDKGIARDMRREVFHSKEMAAYFMIKTIVEYTPETPWKQFRPAITAEKYRAMKVEHETKQKTATEERRLNNLSEARDKRHSISEQIAEIEQHIDTLRGLNLESDAACNAVKYALILLDIDLGKAKSKQSDNEARIAQLESKS